MLVQSITRKLSPVLSSLNTLRRRVKLVLVEPYLKYFGLTVAGLAAVVLSITRMMGFARGVDVSLDSAWYMALAHSWQQGHLLGRDVFFTYGPLAQVLAQFGVEFHRNGSAFDAYALLILVFRVLGIVSFALAIALVKRFGWKYSIFVFLIGALLSGILVTHHYRAWLVVVAAILLSYALSFSGQRRRLIGSGLVGSLAVVLQLISFDMGIYVVLSSIVVLVGYSGVARAGWLDNAALWPARSYLLMLAALLATYAAGNVLISLFFKLSSPAYRHFFDYQLESLEIVRGYNNTFGSPWSLGWTGTTVLMVVIVYNLVYLGRNLPYLAPAEGYLLVCLQVFAFLQLKSALIRSDPPHIVLAFLPMLFTFVLTGYDWRNTNRVQMGWVAVLVLIFATWPMAQLEPLRELADIAQGKKTVLGQLAIYTSGQASPKNIVPSKIREVIDPAKTVLVYPYQYHIGIGLKQPVLEPTLQAYVALTESLQHKFVEVVEQHKAELEIIYGIDPLVSDAIDEVQFVSRLPVIFEYLYRNFDLKSPRLFDKGYFVLQKTSQPREDMQPAKLDLRQLPAGPGAENGTWNFRLNAPADCTMLRLTTRITYPFTSLLGRPNSFVFSLWSQQTVIQTANIVNINPGAEFTTYISLINPAEFHHLFGNKPVATRQWDSLQAYSKNSGLFGVDASSFELRQVECITFNRPAIKPQAPLGELVQGTEFSQTFISQCRDLSQVNLFLATYGRSNSATVLFRLTESASGQIIRQIRLSGSEVKDNTWQPFDFEPISNSAGQAYTVSLISPDGQPGNAITVWSGIDKAGFSQSAQVNQRPFEGSMVLHHACGK